MQSVCSINSKIVCPDIVDKLFLNKEDSCLSFFDQNIQGSDLINRCDSLFNAVVARMNQERESKSLSVSDEAVLLGRCTKFLREMDDVVSDRLGNRLHRYCCCHVKEREVENPQEQLKSAWPMLQNQPIRWTDYPESLRFNSELKHKSCISYSWSLGGGHDVVQGAYGSRAASEGMHIYNVPADEEILKKLDPIHWLSGGRIWFGDITNFLMRHNFWWILRFIHWFFGSESPFSRQLKIDEFLLSMERRGKPDLVISCFDRCLSALEKAANSAERPVLSVATDFDPDVVGISKPDDVHNPDFLRTIMIPLEDELSAELKKHLSLEQIRFTGLPVRNAFLKDYSNEELNGLRNRYLIDSDAQVVVLVAGGEGVQNGYAKLLKEHYEKKRNLADANSLPKIHLFVVTGKNQRQKMSLDKTFASFEHPQLKVNVLGWMQERPMGELVALAAQPVGSDGLRGALVSAKGGGGTLADAAAAGAPLVACDRNPIDWEQRNIDYACRQGLGRRFTEKSEFLPTLLDQLRSSYQPKIDYRRIPSVDNSIELIKELLKKVRDRMAAPQAKEESA